MNTLDSVAPVTETENTVAETAVVVPGRPDNIPVVQDSPAVSDNIPVVFDYWGVGPNPNVPVPPATTSAA